MMDSTQKRLRTFAFFAAALSVSACAGSDPGVSGSPSSGTTSTTGSGATTSAGTLSLLPTVADTTGKLGSSALTFAGDSVMLLGDTASTVGSSLPQPVGGTVVLLGGTVADEGTAVSKLSDPVSQSLDRVGTTSINPIVGTDGLVTPLVAGTSSLLDPIVGTQGDGLTSPVTDPAVTQVASLTGTTEVQQQLGPIVNPVVDPLVTDNGLNDSLLGSVNLTGTGLATGTTTTGSTNPIGSTVNAVTGTLNGATSTGTGLLGTTGTGTGTSTTSGGIVNSLIQGLTQQ